LKSAETNPAIKNRKQTVAWTRTNPDFASIADLRLPALGGDCEGNRKVKVD